MLGLRLSLPNDFVTPFLRMRGGRMGLGLDDLSGGGDERAAGLFGPSAPWKDRTGPCGRVSGHVQVPAPFGPLEGMADGVLDGVFGLPAEQFQGLRRVHEGAHDVAGTGRSVHRLETVADDLPE